MMPGPELLTHIQKQAGLSGSLRPEATVPGGSINKCFKVRCKSDLFFLKVNDTDRFPGMLETEARGLALLGDCGLRVPECFIAGSFETDQFLLLEWCESTSFDASLHRPGDALAHLHRHHAELFGLDHDNFMGSLAQQNSQSANFDDFLVSMRLAPQIKLARDNGFLNPQEVRNFDRLFQKITDLYPAEKPTLIHGDLWSGNYICSNKEVIFFDPAIAFAHREADLAMTLLFGGFPKEFYQEYEDLNPPEKGWRQRVAFWNLYPLLIHLNLFGSSYHQPLVASLKSYI